MPLVYDIPGSWWTQSEGWREIHCVDKEHAKRLRLLSVLFLPYGCYVRSGNIIRVETPALYKGLLELEKDWEHVSYDDLLMANIVRTANIYPCKLKYRLNSGNYNPNLTEKENIQVIREQVERLIRLGLVSEKEAEKGFTDW